MKFCKDCKHRVPYSLGSVTRYDTCAKAPLPPDTDYLVTGEGEVRKFGYCATFRSDYMKGNCGTDAKFFELSVYMEKV